MEIRFGDARIVQPHRVLGDAVHELGGITLPATNKPGAKTADFHLPDLHAVVELKTLEKDLRQSESFRRKAARVFKELVEEGLLRPIEPGQIIEDRELPRECQDRLLRAVFRPIIGAICRDANQQLRQTLDRLGEPAGGGILFLVNDGNPMMHPWTVSQLLVSLLTPGRFRSIGAAVSATANVTLTSAETLPLRCATFFGSRPSAPPSLSEVVERLSERYRHWHTVHQGIRLATVTTDDPMKWRFADSMVDLSGLDIGQKG